MNVQPSDKQQVFESGGVFVEVTIDRGDYWVSVQYNQEFGGEGRREAFDAAIAELEHMQRGCAYLIGRLRTEKDRRTPPC